VRRSHVPDQTFTCTCDRIHSGSSNCRWGTASSYDGPSHRMCFNAVSFAWDDDRLAMHIAIHCRFTKTWKRIHLQNASLGRACQSRPPSRRSSRSLSRSRSPRKAGGRDDHPAFGQNCRTAAGSGEMGIFHTDRAQRRFNGIRRQWLRRRSSMDWQAHGAPCKVCRCTRGHNSLFREEAALLEDVVPAASFAIRCTDVSSICLPYSPAVCVYRMLYKSCRAACFYRCTETGLNCACDDRPKAASLYADEQRS